MDLWHCIDDHITEASGSPFRSHRRTALDGGCINTAQRISGNGREYFVKTNKAEYRAMFSAEARALCVLAASNTVRVPTPVCHGNCGDHCYIVLEYLALGGRADMATLGRQLAAMHACTSDHFGWQYDNTIGLTPQINTPKQNWVAFWRDQRLGRQLKLAAGKGYGAKLQQLGERLLMDFPVLFDTYSAQASLLHGDLWGGNYAALASGEPVIYDPALYYGDRETDLAMTTLFGGFGAEFYAAYDEAWPLDAGYTTRREFYNLYHILNHLNLFGGGYQDQALAVMQRLLSQLR